jgi:hypothetical protein
VIFRSKANLCASGGFNRGALSMDRDIYICPLIFTVSTVKNKNPTSIIEMGFAFISWQPLALG